MTATLEQVLGTENLCGLIQEVKPDLPNPLPGAFLKTTNLVEGNSCTYDLVRGLEIRA